MRTLLTTAYIAAFITASAWAGIKFKVAAESTGKTAIWHFVVGNVIGVACPIALTFALKQSSPSVIYALCYGGAFALLQILSWRLFAQKLSNYQWAGVVFVGIGILLLQIRAIGADGPE